MKFRHLNRLPVGSIGLGTALMYGHSEQVVGLTTAGNRDAFHLATKVWCRGQEQGEAQIVQSFDPFQTAYIDGFQIHNLVDWQTHLVTLERLKAEGKIGLIGITHYTTTAYRTMMEIMRSGRIDTIQIPYNVLESTWASEVLPLAAERGIGVLVLEPLERGRYVKGLRRQPDLTPLTAHGIWTWAQALLAWVLGNPRVRVAIPATSRLAHIGESAAAGPFEPLFQELRDYIHAETARCL
jgi:diketogulonate reductase-like aldo/keto reductase